MVKGPWGGFGLYAVIMRKVLLLFPLYLVHAHLPRLDPSQSLSVALRAALLTEKIAVPPYCLGCLGSKVLLWAQQTCCCGHHSLVLVGSLSCFFTNLQSRLTSTIPKISKSHFRNALSNIVFFQFASLNGESPNVLEAYSENIFFFNFYTITKMSYVKIPLLQIPRILRCSAAIRGSFLRVVNPGQRLPEIRRLLLSAGGWPLQTVCGQ
jgi:hypothetical protein